MGKQGKAKDRNDVNNKGIYILLSYMMIDQVSSGIKESGESNEQMKVRDEIEKIERLDGKIAKLTTHIEAIETTRGEMIEQIAQEFIKQNGADDMESITKQQALRDNIVDLPDKQKSHN